MVRSFDPTRLRRNDRVIVYHGTDYNGFLEMANGVDANCSHHRAYCSTRHKGLFVTNDFETARSFANHGQVVVALRVRAANLHGTDYGGTISRRSSDAGLKPYAASRYADSFRPTLTMSLLQKAEPQALLVGYVPPKEMVAVWVDGEKMSRREAIEAVRERTGERQLADYGFDASSPRIQLRDVLRWMVREHPKMTEQRVLSVLQSHLRRVGMDRFVDDLRDGTGLGVRLGGRAAQAIARQVAGEAGLQSRTESVSMASRMVALLG